MRKKKEKKVQVYIENTLVSVEPDIADRIEELQRKFDATKRENFELQNELCAIKPVIETKKLKPAVSEQCKDCDYVCTSAWSGAIIGCKKDCLCDDYRPKGNEE